jgi:hypothetical protein
MNDYDYTADVLLLNKFKSNFKLKIEYDGTVWFHLTRVLPGNDFKNGILQLKDVINVIGDSLYNLVSHSSCNR